MFKEEQLYILLGILIGLVVGVGAGLVAYNISHIKLQTRIETLEKTCRIINSSN